MQSEIEFLKSFVFLNKIRFGDNFEVNYNSLDADHDKWVIPPVTLQLIIENCIKHNEISKEQHLTIDIEQDGDSIVIENNLNPLRSTNDDSNGVGLKNIVSRYELLTDKNVEVEKSDTRFKVRIPLLTLES